MTTLIIGSVAAEAQVPGWRKPKDLDAFTNEDPESVTLGFELSGDLFWDDELTAILDPNTQRYATVDELYTIKHSHAYWELKNGSWGKHIADLLKLQEAGGTLIPEWHDVLYRVWERRHGKKMVDLTQEADEFFTDAVKRIYDHDSIHRSIALRGKPIYEDCLKDGKTVQIDMDKVWAMPHERIMQMFREEIYVTALERKVIPSGYKYSPGAAYQWALRRTITSLTKGKSAQYLVSHFAELTKPNMDYVGWHLHNDHYLEKL